MSDLEYAFAPGFNNEAGFLTVTSVVTGGKIFWTVQGMGTYDDGEEQVKLSGIHDDIGEPQFSWLFTRLTTQQYEYIISDILDDRRSNQVTVRTRFTGQTYHNVNAIMTMPKTSSLARNGNNYLDVRPTFNLEVVLS